MRRGFYDVLYIYVILASKNNVCFQWNSLNILLSIKVITLLELSRNQMKFYFIEIRQFGERCYRSTCNKNIILFYNESSRWT